MVGNIRIERHPIDVGYLGVFGFDHLHLVFEEEPGGLLNKQDYWPKLEGVRETSTTGAILGTSGGFPSISLSSSWGLFGDDLIAKIGTPESRGSRIIPVSSPEQDAWNEMRTATDEIDNQGLRYIGLSPSFSPQPMMNSTSVIASLLYEVGFDLTYWMPFGVRASPGATTRIGTTGNDEMRMDMSFTTLVGGKGQDMLHGNDNPLQIDKLYGGTDNDLLFWSVGFNIMHGGVPSENYIDDGIDYVDYSGAGKVIIEASKYPLDHWLPQYSAELLTGKDWLFSIERLQWNDQTDEVFVRGSATLFKHGILFKLRQDEGEKGDKVDFNEFDDGLLIHRAADGTLFAGSLSPTEDTNGGIWMDSVEWIVGSAADDMIYSEPGLRGIEGGAGNDLIDAGKSLAFSKESPEGYDIEIYGGDGDDTIVSGSGYTFAEGGDGADRFVLSAMTTTIGDGQVEFVFSGADSDDRLYTAYNFFDGVDGQYEGSDLLPLLGGIKDQLAIYTSETEYHLVSPFVWATDANHDDFDQRIGVINFTGSIYYEYDGNDLLVKLFRGEAIHEIVDIPEDGIHEEYWLVGALLDTETIIRIEDFFEGMLGITFPNEPSGSAVNAILDGGNMESPLELAPNDADVAPGESGGSQDPGNPPVDVPGTDNDDAISSIEGPRAVASGAGNDTVETGAFADILDGGIGADHLTGGGGADLYYVDDAGDVVAEAVSGGIDSVVASIDYTLATAVENLVLRGNAVTATGNGSSNRLEGSSLANTLTGLGGNDALIGGGGDDVLIGGSGSDAYAYIRGDGSDTIEDIGLATDADVLVLSDQIARADLALIRLQSSPLDLVIRIADSGYLTVKGMLGSAATSLEEIVFTDGTRWLRDDILSEAANAPVLDNLPPLAVADRDLVVRSNAAYFDGASLTANDSDTGGGPLTVTAVTNASIGAVSVDAAGFITLTTPENYQDYVTFTYTVSDTAGASATAVAEIYVLRGTPAPNAAPVVTGPAALAVTEDTALAFTATATDADGDTLFYQVKPDAVPAKGTTALVAGNSFTYMPDADANGSDSFTISVSDGRGGSTEQVVTVTIAAVNDAPVAVVDAVSTPEDTTVSLNVIANDTDADGDSIALLSAAASHGTVSVSGGSVTYTPNANFNGTDTVTYEISDGHGGSATGTLTVTVIPVNDAPVTTYTASLSVAEDIVASGNVTATDADGDTLTYVVKAGAGPAKGTVSFAANGAYTYTPAADSNGADTFSIVVSDGNGDIAEQTRRSHHRRGQRRPRRDRRRRL